MIHIKCVLLEGIYILFVALCHHKVVEGIVCLELCSLVESLISPSLISFILVSCSLSIDVSIDTHSLMNLLFGIIQVTSLCWNLIFNWNLILESNGHLVSFSIVFLFNHVLIGLGFNWYFFTFDW